jgi:hypothetical protein
MNRLSVSLLLFVLAAVVASAPSARAGELREGDRIRVHTTDDKGHSARVVGTVVSMDEETLVVRTNGEPGELHRHDVPPHQTRTIPLSAITDVDRWAGTRNYTFIGALIGAAGGLAIGFANQDSNQSEVVDDSGLETLLLGVIGTGVGALVGHFVETDRWDRVDSFSVGVAPSDQGTPQVAMTLSFGF